MKIVPEHSYGHKNHLLFFIKNEGKLLIRVAFIKIVSLLIYPSITNFLNLFFYYIFFTAIWTTCYWSLVMSFLAYSSVASNVTIPILVAL